MVRLDAAGFLPGKEPRTRNQKGLFSGSDLDEVRLPGRTDAPDYSRAAPPPKRPGSRRRPSDQPFLPFNRPSPPPRIPAGNDRRRDEEPGPTTPPEPTPARVEPARPQPDRPESIASGEVAKARDLLQAVRVLKRVEGEASPPDAEERRALARFGGFGAVALRLFPDPVTGQYKSPSWEALGEELRSLLTPEEYDQRQAHRLQRLLHLARGGLGDVRGVEAARRAARTRPCWSRGAARGTS